MRLPIRSAQAGLAAVLLAAGPAAAETWTLATGEDYEPFADPDLPENGLAPAVVEALLATQDVTAEIRIMSWRQAFQQTAAGEIDGAFPYVPGEDRRAQALYSEPLFDVIGRIVTSAEDPVGFDGTSESLVGATVCEPSGYALGGDVPELLAQDRLTKVEPYDLGQCLDLIEAGRADFTAINNFAWPYLLEREDADRAAFQVAQPIATENTLHLIAGQAHPDAEAIVATVNAGLKALKDSGQYRAIIDGHLGDGNEALAATD